MFLLFKINRVLKEFSSLDLIDCVIKFYDCLSCIDSYKEKLICIRIILLDSMLLRNEMLISEHVSVLNLLMCFFLTKP